MLDVYDLILPFEGSWPSPWPTGIEIGVITELADKLQCHCCGEWFANLAQHARLIHKTDADTYRAVWGLKCTQPLISTSMREARSKRAIGRSEITKSAPTREQLSILGQRRYVRTQARRAGQPTFTKEHQIRANKIRWGNKEAAVKGLIKARRRKIEEGSRDQTCDVCGVEFCQVPGKTKKTICGSKSCLSELKRRAAKSKKARK